MRRLLGRRIVAVLAAGVVAVTMVASPAIAADKTPQRQDVKECKMFFKDIIGFSKKKAEKICKEVV